MAAPDEAGNGGGSAATGNGRTMSDAMQVDTAEWKDRWHHIDQLLLRGGPLVGDFEPGEPVKSFLHDQCRILIVGAGGLGCELLKDCALMGFRDIHVIDMDTIDLSNLNRQFLFRKADVGRPKAVVAAEFITRRVRGVKVTPHFENIRNMSPDFYRQFNIIICGLDSVQARRWINSTIVDLVRTDADGNIDTSSIIPIVDGGTEGFKGQARVIIPRVTACIECTLELFPAQVTYPLCTIASKPRLPEHCIEWASVIRWKEVHKEEPLDKDNPDHVQFLFEEATRRAAEFNIHGVTYRLTQGVIKNIIPAVAATNAVISAVCALEAFKIATNTAAYLDNYLMYSGGEGLYTYTFSYERKPDCPVCGDSVLRMSLRSTLLVEEFVERLGTDTTLQCKQPSIMGPRGPIYMLNPPALEAATRGNLTKQLSDLISSGDEISVADPNLNHTLRIEIHFV